MRRSEMRRRVEKNSREQRRTSFSDLGCGKEEGRKGGREEGMEREGGQNGGMTMIIIGLSTSGAHKRHQGAFNSA